MVREINWLRSIMGTLHSLQEAHVDAIILFVCIISRQGSVAPQVDLHSSASICVCYEMCLEPFLRNG